MLKNKEEYNEYMRIYMLNRYHKRRTYYVELLGGKCVACGSTTDLELDHIDPAGKSFNYAKALSGWSKVRLDKEMAKAQLLCGSCHIDKSIVDNGNEPWEHGTLSGYRYCKCSKCKKAKSDYMKEYNLNYLVDRAPLIQGREGNGFRPP